MFQPGFGFTSTVCLGLKTSCPPIPPLLIDIQSGSVAPSAVKVHSTAAETLGAWVAGPGKRYSYSLIRQCQPAWTMILQDGRWAATILQYYRGLATMLQGYRSMDTMLQCSPKWAIMLQR